MRDRAGQTRVAVPQDDGRLRLLTGSLRIYDLAQQAARFGESLSTLARERIGDDHEACETVSSEGRLLAPAHHPEASRCLVTGSGPDWFWKGDEDVLIGPQDAIACFKNAQENVVPGLASIHLVGQDGVPLRLGFTLSLDIADTRAGTAFSRLRPCALGPELRAGEVPSGTGTLAITRRGGSQEEERLPVGEGALPEPFETIERRHFSHARHRRPGDLHVHLLPSAKSFEARPGDRFEFAAEGFGQPMSHPIDAASPANLEIRSL